MEGAPSMVNRKPLRDLSTKESRPAKQVFSPLLTAEAPSPEFFESQLKVQKSSNRWFRFALAGFGRLLSACVVPEVS